MTLIRISEMLQKVIKIIDITGLLSVKEIFSFFVVIVAEIDIFSCRLQLESFAQVKKELTSRKSDVKAKLVIAGGCRHKDDIERAENLRKYAKELGIDER